MFQRMISHVALCGAVTFIASPAYAQFFPGSSFDPCAPARPVASASLNACAPAFPIASTAFTQVASVAPQQQCVTTCQPAPLVPVTQQCYQTVPVTEYEEVKRTVERPVVETRYVDQPVTAYRPITESRVAQVPTVNYQNVTEYQQVTRDMGRWVTHRECIQRPLPCQYDNRTGFMGGMNRFGYSLRSAFSPSFRTRREYIPNYVAQTVPVTRQVAVRGTRQVTYNVTRMEPYQTTRKVAVNSVRMVAEEVTEMQPRTVMKTVPSGTRTTYVSPSMLGTATASLNSPTPVANRNGAVASGRETTVRARTADSRTEARFDRTRSTTTKPYDNKEGAEAFRRNEKTFTKDPNPFGEKGAALNSNLIQQTSQIDPALDIWEPTLPAPANQADAKMPKPLTTNPQPPVRPSRAIPSIVRVNQWSKRPFPATQPTQPVPGVSVAVD